MTAKELSDLLSPCRLPRSRLRPCRLVIFTHQAQIATEHLVLRFLILLFIVSPARLLRGLRSRFGEGLLTIGDPRSPRLQQTSLGRHSRPSEGDERWAQAGFALKALVEAAHAAASPLSTLRVEVEVEVVSDSAEEGQCSQCGGGVGGGSAPLSGPRTLSREQTVPPRLTNQLPDQEWHLGLPLHQKREQVQRL